MSTVRPTPQIQSLAMLALGMGIVGTSMTANKFIVGKMPIMFASGVRFLLAMVIMVGLTRYLYGTIPNPPRQVHLALAAQALFGVFAFNVLVLIGVEMTTASLSGIVTAGTPAVIALMSFALGDRLRPLAWTGIGLTIAGVILVNILVTPDSSAAPRPLLGAVLIGMAVVGEAAYTVIGRYTTRELEPFVTATWIIVYGTAMFLPFAIYDTIGLDITTIPVSSWLGVIYLSLVVTIIAFVVWFVGLRHTPASIAGAFTGMIPITAVLSAALVLGEHITLTHIGAIVLILIGIGFVARGQLVTSQPT